MAGNVHGLQGRAAGQEILRGDSVRDKQPYELCPRYAFCNVNNCPLDPAYPGRTTHPDDEDKKCTLPKTYRVKVAGDFPGILQYEGMTPREYAGLKAWENKSQEEKVESKKRLQKFAFTPDNQGENKKLRGLVGGEYPRGAKTCGEYPRGAKVGGVKV